MRVHLHEIKLLLSFSAMKTSHSHGIVATFECYHVKKCKFPQLWTRFVACEIRTTVPQLSHLKNGGLFLSSNFTLSLSLYYFPYCDLLYRNIFSKFLIVNLLRVSSNEPPKKTNITNVERYNYIRSSNLSSLYCHSNLCDENFYHINL